MIASQPIHGHVLPLLPIARELLARGHEVRWYTGRKYADRVRALGAEVEPFVHARDYDDAAFGATFPGRDDRAGLRQIQFDLEHVFLGQVEGQLHDLRAVARRWPPDAVLAEQTMSAALLLEELGGPPVALLGILPLGIPSRDTAPFGLGLRPDASPPGRWRNRALRLLADRVVFGRATRQLGAVCRRLGLPPRPFAPPVAPRLMLQPSVPGFEYPRSDLPRHLHFVGPLFPPAPPDVPPPAWWPEVVVGGRPVVLVTQGTLATRAGELIVPTLRGLAGEDLLVVAAGVRDPAELGELPGNARVAPFLPFAALLPHVAVYVTNGGYGGVQQALAHGVPVVAAGTTEDKAEVAGRVEYAGVGLNLRTNAPPPGQVRGAVRSLLGESPFRRRARELGAELRRHDAPREAATLVETLARTGRRVEVGPGLPHGADDRTAFTPAP
nr:nucleotide disphospho-sugar-binding domain-containing protein [Deinococcus aestuarii]